MIYRFGECELDTHLFSLRRGGAHVPLRPKVFQVLTYLLEQRHRVVTRQELFEQVWPKQFVSDAALESCIKAVRQATGDSGAAPRIIQTLRGYGYRFMAAVETGADVPADGVTGPALHQDQVVTPSPPPSSPLVGERKPVTILCCGLAVPTTPHEPLELDALHGLMRELYELARGEMQRYGGTIHHLAGDRLMALFGVPVAQEDHARRAVLAALELHQKLSASRAGLHLPNREHLKVCMGLHTGLVAVGGIDAARDTAATVIGDIELVARALQEMAEPDSIVCSNTTARQVRGLVYLDTLQPLQGLGWSSPIMAHRVLGLGSRRSPVVQRGERALSRFVGRQRELATLQALLAQAEGGRGQVAGLVGEPGIGKSRLMYEFRRSLAGRRLTYLEGRCLSYGSSTPYLPVLDILRHNCGITDADRPEAVQAKVRLSLQEVQMAPDEWAPYLLELLGVPQAGEQLATLSRQAIKARTFATLTRMCVNGARQRPLVLAIEDLHWIDPTSEEYLVSLVEQMAGVPILLLTTYRPGYRPPWMTKSYVTQTALQRLTSDDSLRVVRATLHARQIPEALSRTILTKADGNPFFLEELTCSVMEHREPRSALAVPDTIQAVLAARIDRLPGEEKRLLQTAAVIGKDVVFPLLQAVAGLPEEELQRRLVELQDAEFVYETARFPELAYTFKHVLTQEVAYGSLLRSTRQHIHQRIAQVLVERFPEIVEAQPELLAHHYTEAGLGEQAVGYWQRAGEHANQRSAHAEAIAHLTRGIDLLKTLPQTPRRPEQELSLQIALGTALTASKGWAAPEVEQVYTRARELCQRLGETPQLGPVLWGLWHFHAVRGEPQTARELGEQFLGLARRAQDPASLLAANFVLGGALCLLGEFVAAREHWERSLTCDDPQRYCSHALLYGADPGVFCLAWSSHLLWQLGYAEQALSRSEEALALARKLSHAFSSALALDYAAMLQQFHREPRAVGDLAEAAMALCAEQEFAYYLAWARIMRGWSVAETGDGGTGLVEMRQGLAALRATGAGLRQPYYLGLLAEACGKAGRAEEGVTLLAEALKLVDGTGERWWEAELHRLKGELLLRRAPRESSRSPLHREAETCFPRGLEIARRQQAKSLALRAAVSLCGLWQQQGKVEEACRLLTPIYGWFTEGFDTADLHEARVFLEQLT